MELRGLSVMTISPVKMAEPINMPFGLQAQMNSRNHVLDGVQVPSSWEGAVLRAEGHAQTFQQQCAMSCAKMAEPIEMPCGIWTWVSPSRHLLGEGAHWRHLANTIEPSVCVGDAACCQNYFDHLLMLYFAIFFRFISLFECNICQYSFSLL